MFSVTIMETSHQMKKKVGTERSLVRIVLNISRLVVRDFVELLAWTRRSLKKFYVEEKSMSSDCMVKTTKTSRI